eukprot:TRINITY_DN13461_c0_g1_i1.p1 TRINITY_DN13461_c0_g1~~TRINITY_DN13461_c0_g1_i1.p1  ORF type:complete len:760 (-),score=156.24 TRINITY_DN13461_c0_g1_i1:43-2322(-)
MRLKVVTSIKHDEVVSAVGWDGSNELLSCGDDKSMFRWNMSGESIGQLQAVDTCCTDLAWHPSSRQRKSAAAEYFVVGCTDGTFRFVTKQGRVEKQVDGHKGAIITVRWSLDGTALATTGEDGAVKVWSKSGMLRTNLAQTTRAVFTAAWSPEGDAILYATGGELIIKPLQPTAKEIAWKAHDAPVLKVDWNIVNNLIVSCGEDKRYKVWDHFGRLVFQSKPLDYAVTCVAWSPDGELFAVGAFNTLRVCDKTGFVHAQCKVDTGSLLSLSWTTDGTLLAGAGGSGAVCFAQLVERRLSWRNLQVTQTDSNKVAAYDVLTETTEDFDYKDRVVDMSLGYDHLIVAIPTQCYVYGVQQWGAPYLFDLKDTTNFILQTQRYFAIVDSSTGIQVYGYDGKLVSNPKAPSIKPELLARQTVALANDCVAVVDRTNAKTIVLFDTNSGKPLAETITHKVDVIEINFEQGSTSMDRLLYVLDRNKDLYMTPIRNANLVKLGSVCDSARWHDETGMLSAIMDRQFVVWYYPNVVHVDRDILPKTRFLKDASEFGPSAHIVGFTGTTCTIRRMDGTEIAAAVSASPTLLYTHCERAEWEQAIRLCRYIKDDALWACLAAMAVNGRELNAAEVAYAAIREVDKVQFITHVKEIPTEEGRNAELLVFQRKPKQAETILLGAQLYYRAVKMCVRLFQWERALQIAAKYRVHIDTVVGYRQRYLKSFNIEETNKHFIQYGAGLEINWDNIKARIQAEKTAESERPGAQPYS